MDRRSRSGGTRANRPGRKPAQDVPRDDRRHRRRAIKLADRLHNMRTLSRCLAKSRSASRNRRWRSTRRSRTGSVSGNSNPSWKISPSAIQPGGIRIAFGSKLDTRGRDQAEITSPESLISSRTHWRMKESMPRSTAAASTSIRSSARCDKSSERSTRSMTSSASV